LPKAQVQAFQLPVHISYFLQNCKKRQTPENGTALLKIADMQSGPRYQTYLRISGWMISSSERMLSRSSYFLLFDHITNVNLDYDLKNFKMITVWTIDDVQ